MEYRDVVMLDRYVLRDAGFQLIFAENGPQAIAMAREHRPDVKAEGQQNDEQ
jgi:hypothetical protein